MTKLKPFDLQIALADPSRVVHENGKKIAYVFHAPNALKDRRVFVVYEDGDFDPFFEDGRYLEYGEPLLFLAPKKTGGWVNIYPPEFDWETARTSDVRKSKEKADEAADSTRIACVYVEWEE